MAAPSKGATAIRSLTLEPDCLGSCLGASLASILYASFPLPVKFSNNTNSYLTRLAYR